MNTIFPRITVDPTIQAGKPVIEGTRVPVEVIVGHIAAGDTIETVVNGYNIQKADVMAALQYAAHAVAGERVTVQMSNAVSY